MPRDKLVAPELVAPEPVLQAAVAAIAPRHRHPNLTRQPAVLLLLLLLLLAAAAVAAAAVLDVAPELVLAVLPAAAVAAMAHTQRHLNLTRHFPHPPPPPPVAAAVVPVLLPIAAALALASAVDVAQLGGRHLQPGQPQR